MIVIHKVTETYDRWLWVTEWVDGRKRKFRQSFTHGKSINDFLRERRALAARKD